MSANEKLKSAIAKYSRALFSGLSRFGTEGLPERWFDGAVSAFPAEFDRASEAFGTPHASELRLKVFEIQALLLASRFNESVERFSAIFVGSEDDAILLATRFASKFRNEKRKTKKKKEREQWLSPKTQAILKVRDDIPSFIGPEHLKKLNERERAVFELRVIRGVGVKTTTELLVLTSAQVIHALGSAIKKLRGP